MTQRSFYVILSAFLFLSYLFPPSASAQGYPSATPAHPWALSIIEVNSGSCDTVYSNATNNRQNIFYASPDAAMQDAYAIWGGFTVQSSIYQPNNNPPSVTYNIYGASCFPGGYFYFVVTYSGTNFGQVCGDGSYVENGRICAAQQGKVLGNRKCSSYGQYCVAGDPVDTASGNMFYGYADYSTAGMNGLGFTRYYNSLAQGSTYATALGRNWRHTYNRYLNIVSSSQVTAERADGQGLNFTASGGSWISDSDIDLRLTHTGSGSGSSWVLKDSNDVTEVYTQLASGQGRLDSITYRNGYSQSLSYNGSNQLTGVSDSYSRSLAFTYTSGLLSTVTAPNGLVMTYSYASSGVNPGVNDRLSGVSYSTSPATSQSFGYSSSSSTPFALTSVTDENGNVYNSWTYDSAGRGLSSQHAGGADLTTVSYDDSSGQRTVTNALGQQELYSNRALQGIPKVYILARLASSGLNGSLNFEYDGNGYIASKQDYKGNFTSYTNNSRGGPTSITEADGSSVARTTTIAYDTTWVHLPAQVTAPLVTTTFTYDTHGNMLTRTQTDTSGGSTNGQTRSWTYTYDSTGHVLTETGPRTDVTQTTTFTYSGNNIATITDPLSHVYTVTSYNANGQPTAATDMNGVSIGFAYDSRTRSLGYGIYGLSGTATTSYGYDAAGNVTSITLPDSVWHHYSYDTAHRLTKTTDAAYNYDSYTLNAIGNVTQSQSLNSAASVKGSRTAVFDTIGRKLKDIGAYSQATEVNYDLNGNVTYIFDALNHTQSYTYDALNRKLTYKDANNKTTTYAYDAQDNLTSITDPNGLATSYSYDGFGQLLSVTSPDSGTTSYTLDKAGNRTSETDGRVIVTNRTFDKLNRVTAVSYPAASGENRTYSYDSTTSGNYGVGHLTSFTDESGSTNLKYNERGDILTDSRTINSTAYTTSYGYNLADRVTSMTYPSGHIISTTYDATGKPSSISYKPTSTGTSTSLASGISYLATGPQYYTFTYGNSLLHNMIWDQDLKLTAIVTKKSDNSFLAQNLGLSYDDDYNITTISDYLDGTRTKTYTYDNTYRLTKDATGKYGTLIYAYDNNGNRSSIRDNGRQYDYNYTSGTNRLLNQKLGSTTKESFTYDNSGNTLTDTISAGSITYSYSNWNKLKQLVNSINSTTATYKYNGLGQRASKTIGSTTTNYIYDTNNHLIAEYSGSTLQREYIYLNDEPLAQIDASGNIYYIHNDHLNTPQKATDSTQTIVYDNITEAFGEPYSLTGTLTNNLRFPGQLFDGEGTLNYNANRYYSYWHGRYTQPDPIGLNGGINPYVYTQNNPVNRIDPSGLYDENDFTIDSLQALAGFSDTLTLGGSSYARRTLGTDYADTCSLSYGAGEVTGYLAGSAGAIKAVFKKATASVEKQSLYRAVTDAELKDIRANGGAFNPSPSGLEAKYFSTTPEGAASYAKQIYGSSASREGALTIVKTNAPSSILERAPYLDRGVPTVTIKNSNLGQLSPAKPLNYSPIPNVR